MSLLFLKEYLGVILFYSAVVLLVYINRERFDKQASFIYLYKTKFGLKLMDSTAKRFNKFLKIVGYVGIAVAYIGFFFITYALISSAYDLIIDKPGAVGGSPVIPGLPIAGLGVKFPLIIGWISLFIIMIVHEFSHGVIARVHNVRVKSSGIAFFGPLLGAFVEPDEEDLMKKPHKVQHSIFAAGPVSNVLLWLICILLLLGITSAVSSMTQPEGVRIGIIQEDLPAFISRMPENSVITGVGQYNISTLASLTEALDSLSPGQNITLYTENSSYSMITTSHPDNETKAYLGIWIYGEDRKLKNDDSLNNLIYQILNWLFELFKWTGFISINIGLINLFPIFITDGARMLKLNFDYLLKDTKKATSYWKNLNIAALFVVLILLFLPLLRTIFKALFSIAF